MIKEYCNIGGCLQTDTQAAPLQVSLLGRFHVLNKPLEQGLVLVPQAKGIELSAQRAASLLSKEQKHYPNFSYTHTCLQRHVTTFHTISVS